ncbi:MAG: DUF4145 domain-containing protein [Bacteroidota bacterium]
MICPHCSTVVKFDWYTTKVFEYSNGNKKGKQLQYSDCLNCSKLVVILKYGDLDYNDITHDYSVYRIEWEKTIYPKKSNFENSQDIPEIYLEDYEEAIKVLSASSKASAALSRRLLQSLLRDKFKIKKKTLAQEIQAFIELDGVPSHLTDAIDAVRNIGNLAAHPTKNINTGEIVAVEKGEAEWIIEVIEALFDFVFIQPLKLERRREELNLKLEEIGKPPLKKKK